MSEFLYWDDTTRDIVNAEEIYIYGAGLMGKALKLCLTEPPYLKKVSSFLVGDNNNKLDNIDEIKVRNVSDIGVDRSKLVLVALHEKNLKNSEKLLEAEGYNNVRIVSFDCNEWNHIRSNWIYYKRVLNENAVFDVEICKPKVTVYVAHSDVDKRNDESVPFKDYEVPIQVGAKLSKVRLCQLSDDVGENISEKNRQYCELTALYWIWKHHKSEYMGLSHYRRRFVLESSIYDELKKNSIDMVVTTPILNLSGVRTQYGIDHSVDDWDILMELIGALTPEYLNSAKRIQDRTYYYGYNMFIARYDVFYGYCEWLFRILGECEKRIGIKKDSYQNRYIGNLSERMLGMYIEKNNLKIMISDKLFISK